MSSSKISLEEIRPCLEGLVPASIATCDAEGVPNITYVSQVHYIDSKHVGLTFQFFNKTRKNILANPHATVNLAHPDTGAQYRLALLYLKTEDKGPLFESMKAKLAGIASNSGMEKVFRLLGADVYQVLDIEEFYCKPLVVRPKPQPLIGLRQLLVDLANRTDNDDLFQAVLNGLHKYMHINHSILLLADGEGRTLYTVASHGYPDSGVGSEVPVGFGIIGTAAAEKIPIRIAHATTEYGYAQAMQAFSNSGGESPGLETNIPYPGLELPNSQVAVPLLHNNRLLGVLFVEREEDVYFSYDDEDALVSLAIYLSQAMVQNINGQEQELQEEDVQEIQESSDAALKGPALQVRYYPGDGSIFIDQEYLIKGVAGSILWRLIQLSQSENRNLFSNRELRLDKSLGLPDIGDNLEARLILLQRRLDERCDHIKIQKNGRGKFNLLLTRPVNLVAD